MTFHELATNALKHGSLSVERGAFDVNWHCDAANYSTEEEVGRLNQQNRSRMAHNRLELAGIKIVRVADPKTTRRVFGMKLEHSKREKEEN